MEKFAKDLAYEAGEIIKENFTLGMDKKWKEDDSLVTKTDTRINSLVIDAVKNNYPDHDVLAEEESDFSNKSKHLWVCDPVDGTIPFSHGIPTCVFSLAYVMDGESRLGVVYDPFSDRLFFAEKGKGAYLNGNKITVSEKDSLKHTIVGVSRWSGAKYELLNIENDIFALGANTIDLGCLIYMGALVACGELAGVIFPGSKAHDAAALKVIVEEAGGKATDLYGDGQRFDGEIKGLVASNGKTHQALVEAVNKSLKLTK